MAPLPGRQLPRRLRLLGLTALGVSLVAVPPARAHAQDTAAVVDTTTQPLPRVDGFRLQPTTLTYRATLIFPADTARPAGLRTVHVAPALYAGGSTWSLSERVDSVATATSDSVVLDRFDLLPVHWEGERGPARIAAELARDTLYAAASWPTGRHSITQPLGGFVLTTAGHAELVVSLLPLHPAWRGTARLLLVDLGGARIVPVTFMVEGVETIETPAGRFDCWVVGMYGDRIADHFWVARDRPLVVRHTTQVPVLGAQLDQLLERIESR